MMNYIAEIKVFQDIAQDKQLSSGQIALWYALMYINNRCGWQEWFTVANLSLQLNSGLSRQGIVKNRNVLKQFGLIEFRSNGTKATSYKIVTTSKSVQSSLQDSVQSSLQDSIQSSSTLNKLNETKLNETKKEKNKKEKFGEYGHVKMLSEQYQKLCDEYGQAIINDYIERIDEWIQLNGKKEYSDSNLAIKNWLRRDNVQPKPKAIEQIEQGEAVQARTADEIKNMSLEELFISG